MDIAKVCNVLYVRDFKIQTEVLLKHARHVFNVKHIIGFLFIVVVIHKEQKAPVK